MDTLEFPSLLAATEKVSASAQKSFFFATGSAFLLLAVASLAALVSPSGSIGFVGSIVSVASFIGALVIQLSSAKKEQEQKWYQARAASESIKTASWEFAVGGEAFRLDDATAEDRFSETLREILSDLKSLDIGTAVTTESSATESMAALREADLATRAETYRSQRVDDQVKWYSAKAAQNKNRNRRYIILVVCVEVIAILLGLFSIAGHGTIDLMSPAAAIAAGLIGWMQAKKFANLSVAYAVTSHEVSLIPPTLFSAATEPEWAQAVHDAEAAFSREHTMWLARRQGPV
ncbi:hypothetical protein CA40472_04750 [Corynebacterium ammoniagenes]|nr:hypothetical protein CA40472_04750 [Corynebacterium ammoniagenes]